MHTLYLKILKSGAPTTHGKVKVTSTKHMGEITPKK